MQKLIPGLQMDKTSCRSKGLLLAVISQPKKPQFFHTTVLSIWKC
ncbi:hypothetical protein DSUL_60283 [Desulfovibrionales bacterium]